MESNAGLIQSRDWCWVTWALDIHLLGVPLKRTSTQHGVVRNSLCSKVNLSASFTSRVVAVIALIDSGHLAVTRSSLLDRYATNIFQGPRVCMRTSQAVLLASSVYTQNNLVMSQRTRARAFFKASKALCSALVHSKVCILPVLSQKGVAISIHSWQYPTAPTPGIPACFFNVRVVTGRMARIQSWESVHLPSSRLQPRYMTCKMHT